MDLASVCRRRPGHKIAKMRGIPDTPANEAPFQKRRKQLVIAYFALLLLLSIAVELHNRGISIVDVLIGARDVLIAFSTPDTPGPYIDWIGIIGGLVPIIRNIIPPIVVLWFVLRLGATFAKGVYGLSFFDANTYLGTSLFGPLRGERLPDVSTRLALSWTLEELLGGGGGGSGPFVVVDNGALRGVGSQDPVMSVGGPGSIVVGPDSAALLERAGQLTRMVGPGVYPLQRFEKVRDVINVRSLQSRTVEVRGMSREGIPVVWPLEIHYRVDDQGDGFHPATENQPYVFSEDAVLRASSARLMQEPDESKHPDWGDLMAGAAEGGLRNLLARYPLDRLIRPLYDGDTLPRQEIEAELEDALRANAANQGAKLLRVDLQNIELEDPIAQQWVERWQAEWKRLATEELARGEAERAYQMERIRAEAQGMLVAITEGLEQMDGVSHLTSADIVSLRLIETLRQIAEHPHAFLRIPFPEQLIETWEQLRKLIESSAQSIPPQAGEPE
jgi:regulator of protease activity HflC (stomatin/prohibitin superfamily)